MRVVLWVDMEGAAGIDDYRACLPAYPEYWDTGRNRLTDDVVAAVDGLHSGGASTGVLADIHGPGWFKNVVTERLPEEVTLATGIIQPEDVDVAFHVGFHARCGTAEGFMSHTHVPEFRVKVDGALVTENHVLAWMTGVPVIGITGDCALEAELDGILSGTPFLEVKHSTSRTATTLRYPDPAARADAISAFARECLRDASNRSTPTLPGDSEVIVSMNPGLIEDAFTELGWRRGEATLTIYGSDWQREIWPAVRVAARAASRPLDEFASQLDLTHPAVVTTGDAQALRGLRDRFDAWMHTVHPAWVE